MQVDPSELKASLVQKSSSRTAWTVTQRNPVLKKQEEKKRKNLQAQWQSTLLHRGKRIQGQPSYTLTVQPGLHETQSQKWLVYTWHHSCRILWPLQNNKDSAQWGSLRRTARSCAQKTLATLLPVPLRFFSLFLLLTQDFGWAIQTGVGLAM